MTVEDSIFADGGLLCSAGVGLLWHYAADGVLAHNAIRRLRYTGITVGWTWAYVPTSTANVSVSKNTVADIGMASCRTWRASTSAAHSPAAAWTATSSRT